MLFAAMTAAGCDKRKSENPLSPDVAGPIPGVSISAPKLIEPAPGQRVATDTQPLKLVIENAVTSGQRPLTYLFEVATDAAFANKVFTQDNVPQGAGNRTSVTLPGPLSPEKAYFWRAQAKDGANTGVFAGANAFDVFTPILIQAPTAMAPINGVRVSDQRPRFAIKNAARSGPVSGHISYRFEISSNDQFTDFIAVITVVEQPNETSYMMVQPLDFDQVIYWRVKGFDAAGNQGEWTGGFTFRTPIRPPDAQPPQAPNSPAAPATVFGFLRDQLGQGPIGGARVYVVDGVNANKGATTDGNGYFSIPGLTVPATFTLRAERQGFHPADKPLTVTGDRLVDVFIRRVPATITGTVSNVATGERIRNVRVFVVDGVNANKSATTDSAGFFSIPGLTAPSTFTLRAVKANYLPDDVGLTLEGDRRIDFFLQDLTPPTPGPGPGPSPGPSPPPPGGKYPTNGQEVINYIYANYPQYLGPTGSLAQRQANMERVRDLMIEAGICGGMDLAWNDKRGGPSISIDFLVHRVGGNDLGLDIARSYDSYNKPMVLTWVNTHTNKSQGVFYHRYPRRPSCP
jgi:hypothetical protein